MKKKLWFILLVVVVNMQAQTLLSSHKLTLRKPFDKQQLFSFSDPAHQSFFVLVSDKSATTALQYNSALFLRDSITVSRVDDAVISGSGFSSDGLPYVFWTADSFSKITAVGYDFAAHSTISKQHQISYEHQTFLTSFIQNERFYILTVSDEQQELNLHEFFGSSYQVHALDFSKSTFRLGSGKAAKLADLIERYPIEKMESRSINPLFLAAAKSKLYLETDAIWLTLDHFENMTQLFRISLSDYSVSEQVVQQPVLTGSTSSNSFLKGGRLFQLRANSDELVLSCRPLTQNTASEVYRYQQSDSVTERNSPFLFQQADRRPSEVKSFKKFLNRISGCDLGLSVYEVDNELLLTVGGVRRRHDTGTIIVGTTLGLGLAVGGGSVALGDDLLGEAPVQQFFFEALFDKDFKHLVKEQSPLAVDYLSNFLAENKSIILDYLTPFKDYFIFSYYDAKTREVKLRKFSDGAYHGFE